jgi:lipopolysaccharide/colanic/teichoic acid biosynthesis glycosyltransferase
MEAHRVRTDTETALVGPERRNGTAPQPLLFDASTPPRAARAISKRAFDITASLAMLVLLLPLLGFVALLVRLDSPGPVIFRSRRVGFRGRRLDMLKFRKFHHDATGAALTVDDDHRFTRLGLWLTRLSVDELPQLWHVLVGEMSVVGPRPESEAFTSHYPAEYAEITQVKPGLIGLSQLAFADESRILDDDDPVDHYLGRILPEKLSLDRLYAQNWSFWLDVKIIFWAVVVIFLRRPVAVNRATGRMSLRTRKPEAEKAPPSQGAAESSSRV